MSDIPVQAPRHARREMLPPSEVLNRFDPPAGFMPVATEATARIVRYGFRAAGFALLIRQGMGSEVVPMMPFATIPNGPSWLQGMINLHGNLVPVCDLGRALGGGTEPGTSKAMILVLDKGEAAVGFVIDGYPCAIAGLRPASQVHGLPELLARHVQATLATEEEVWLEFDHEGFLEEANQQ